jgi:Sec-independent protein translocase protein TatA
MLKDIGWPEALIILAIVLLIFSAGKLPEVWGSTWQEHSRIP